MNNYKLLNSVGKGSYSKVYCAINNQDPSNYVALKTTQLHPENGVPSYLIREIGILKSLSHPNIVHCEDVFLHKDSIVIALNLMEKTLQPLCDIQRHRYIKIILYQIINAIHVIHTNDMIHCDIKPENILISDKNKDLLVQLCDFNLSMIVRDGMFYPHKIQTLNYRAPEVMLGYKYDFAIDIWSVGCVCAFLITGETLFPGNCSWMQLMNIFQIFGTPSNDTFPGVESLPFYSKLFPQWNKKGIINYIEDKFPLEYNELQKESELFNLLERLLDFNPLTRITAREALHHPYFSTILLPKSISGVAPDKFTHKINKFSIKESYIDSIQKWLLVICQKLGIEPDVFFLCIEYIKYLIHSGFVFDSNNSGKICAVCLWIACKYLNSQFTPTCESLCTSQKNCIPYDILEAEKNVLTLIGFRINMPTLYNQLVLQARSNQWNTNQVKKLFDSCMYVLNCQESTTYVLTRFTSKDVVSALAFKLNFEFTYYVYPKDDCLNWLNDLIIVV